MRNEAEKKQQANCQNSKNAMFFTLYTAMCTRVCIRFKFQLEHSNKRTILTANQKRLISFITFTKIINRADESK